MSVGTATYTSSPSTSRLTSMDAYRGFVMICLAANGFGLKKVSENFSNNTIWQAIGYQFDHVTWVGCAFWDLIQPSFMFLVGVALPYSYSRREASGETSQSLIRHVLVRSLVLVLLGIFLSSGGTATTNFTFMNVLTQIGLGYPFLYFMRNKKLSIQMAAAIGILAGYWGIFAISPAVSIGKPEVDKLPANYVMLEGFEAHWQKHENVAANFDRWFLNIFPATQGRTALPGVPEPPNSDAKPAIDGVKDNPINDAGTGLFERSNRYFRRLMTRPEPYVFNSGGYQTLNFIPSIVTMLIGLMAGEFIRSGNESRSRTFAWMLLSGLILLALGWGWQYSGLCPLVKRIWTPSWTLFSTGWTLIMLSGFYGIIDGLGWKAWSFPLVVAGTNSMVLYLSGQLLRPWTSALLKRHVNDDLFRILGDSYSPLVESSLVLLCFWLFVYWLYRQRLFVRI